MGRGRAVARLQPRNGAEKPWHSSVERRIDRKWQSDAPTCKAMEQRSAERSRRRDVTKGFAMEKRRPDLKGNGLDKMGKGSEKQRIV